MDQTVDISQEIQPQYSNMIDDFLQKTVAAHYMIASAVIVVLALLVLYMYMYKEKATDMSGALGTTSTAALQKQEQVGLQPGVKNDALAGRGDVAFDMSLTNQSVPYDVDKCNSADGYADEAYAWVTGSDQENMMIAKKKENMAGRGLSDFTLSATMSGH